MSDIPPVTCGCPGGYVKKAPTPAELIPTLKDHGYVRGLYNLGWHDALACAKNGVEKILLMDHGDVKVSERRIPIHLVIDVLHSLEKYGGRE
jgi:hypothetical protein